MRRKDREIAEPARIADILRRCPAASFAFAGGAPYVVPMSFGFEESGGRFTLYMHCACEGKKLERMRADPRAAFAAFTGNAVHGEGNVACAYSTSFDSVCGEGVLRELAGEDKRRGLVRIMAQAAPGHAFTFDDAVLEKTCVLALDVERISGKHHD
ncbi:MAG: pyridoxamine 5'-phosphate oxidase family protein [Candidatus Ventricola sp.]